MKSTALTIIALAALLIAAALLFTETENAEVVENDDELLQTSPLVEATQEGFCYPAIVFETFLEDTDEAQLKAAALLQNICSSQVTENECLKADEFHFDDLEDRSDGRPDCKWSKSVPSYSEGL